MSAVICFPTNGSGLPFARIYRAESSQGQFSQIANVSAKQMEYEDPDGNASCHYAVVFSDGDYSTDQTVVKSLNQQVIDVIRTELKITSTALSDENIDFLIDLAKSEVILDICTYYRGIQITKQSDDKFYQLPNRYFFDHNCGGVISNLDFEFYKQETPIYIYTEKIPVIPVYVDPEERYVQLEESLASNEILKVNFYSCGRKLNHINLVQLIAYKLCTLYYDTSIMSSTASNASKVKIGDITIENNSSSGSSTSTQDAAYKMNAKYQKLLNKVKVGFRRTN